MHYIRLNKQNNTKLIVFFAGWSFDEKPFLFLDCSEADVLFVCDYNKISTLDEKLFKKYTKKFLISWSMGVFTAYLLKNNFKNFDRKIAVNGTPFPVHDDFGIPQKPFLLTLRHAKTGLEGKFYQNIFEKEAEFERYSKTPVTRSIDNRVDELKSLYEKIKSENFDYENFYDFALISAHDKIIPTKNQINFWQNHAPFKILESGHFPFYNFKSWDEIIKSADNQMN